MSSRPSPGPWLLLALVALVLGVVVATSGWAETPEDGETSERDITLRGNLTETTTGQPLPGVEISIVNERAIDPHRPSEDPLTVATSSAGEYSIDLTRGEVQLSIDETNHTPLQARFFIEEDVRLDLPVEPVPPEQGWLAGTITAEGEAELADVDVSVFCASGPCTEQPPASERTTRRTIETGETKVDVLYEPRHSRVVTVGSDAAGDYSVRRPAGVYDVVAEADGHLSGTASVDVPAGGSVRADVALTPIPPASVTVEGRLVDAETGEALEGAGIGLANQRWGTHTPGETDPEGRFELATEPGYAKIFFVAGQHRGHASDYLPAARTLQAEANETVPIHVELEPTNATMILDGPPVRVAGWVVNASSGRPIPKAAVVFENAETNDWGQAETGPDGSFQIEVAQGFYTVHVGAEGFFVNATNLWASEGSDPITLRLTPGELNADASHLGGIVVPPRVHNGTSERGDTFPGGPGDLGPPPAVASRGERIVPTPTPAVALVVTALILGARWSTWRTTGDR